MTRPAWVVRPSGPLRGVVAVPGDKSVSHRVMLLGAVASAPLVARGFLRSADCLATRRAVEMLGATVEDLPDGRVRVSPPRRLHQPGIPLDFGNSGTGLRLMTGLLAGRDVDAELTGDESLRGRPMERVAAPLRRMGAVLETSAGCPPVKIKRSGPLRPIEYDLPVASAQVKSALLLAGLAATGRTVVRQPAVTRDHTERMLAALGCPVEMGSWGAAVAGPCQPRGGDMIVPGDFSSAAFFIVAGLLAAGEDPLVLTGVGLNPTRTGLLDILRLMGARIEARDRREACGEEVAELRIWRSPLRGIDVPPELVPLAIDEFPVLFVAAALAHGTTRVRGAEELRVKESDRLGVMARALASSGIEVTEHPDGLDIRGGRLRGGTVDSGGDHRVAMAFAVAATRAEQPMRILDVANVATSYPGFAIDAARLGIALEALDGENAE
jgi:3-phosphoshikimate 1-carboxyvinyltransferase